ncbi:MAG: nicotinate-nucleotide adenylyltransferase [Nitrospirota bacterium]
MAIGLFGGTFDPIHNGHIQVAKRVVSLLKLSGIFFIPAKIQPHKQYQKIAKVRDRMKMIALAIFDDPRFVLCDLEIKRRGVSYTIDTLLALRKCYPNETFVFIIGTDAFAHLASWKAPERLLELCSFVIVPRAGTPFSDVPHLEAITEINKAKLAAMDQNARRSYTYRLKSGTKLYFRKIATVRISASHLRAQLNAKQMINGLLPKGVLSYIMKRKLYQ